MSRSLEFPPFRIDLGEQRLLRADRPLKLRPKTFGVLTYLVARAPALVTQKELLNEIWGDVAVTPGTLSQSITELRRALDDDARRPRFIETVHRRGYRFLASVSSSTPADPPGALAPWRIRAAPLLVGRESEFAQLEASFQAAETGHRQLVFVTGEPGIGKTSLVRCFLGALTEREGGNGLWVAMANCVELHGESEAYLPVLNALDRLAREDRGKLRSALARFAPSWLPHLPRLAADDGDTQPSAAARGLTPARMIRELCVAFDELAQNRTLVLWLEDLHWCDNGTLDLLAALARRPDPARLLVLASYRPVDAAVAAHPVAALKRSLLEKGEARELALGLLKEHDMGAYLRGRFAWELEPVGLASAIYQQSEGNPLFMVTLANRIAAEAGAAHPGATLPLDAVPDFANTFGTETLRELVEIQISKMGSEDVEVLEAASVAGSTLAAQSVAAALGVEDLWVEKVCGRLAAWGLFIEDAGAGRWPDGSTGERYSFLHDVFRRVLYDRISAARRQRLHRRIGERLAMGYESPPGRAPAAELAMHFERGGDSAGAVDWLERAAAGVRRRFADREAVDYLERAIVLLAGLPACEERDRKELSLRLELAEALLFAAGIAPETNAANLKPALKIANRLDEPTAAMTVLTSLVRVHWISPALAEAEAYLDPLLALESRVDDGPLRAHAHANASIVAVMKGELPRARCNAKVAWDLIEEEEDPTIRFVTSDPGVQALYAGALAEWLMGHPARAETLSRRGVERAPDPYRRVASLLFRGHLTGLLRSIDEADRVDRELERLQEEYGYGLPYAYEPTRKGWLLWQRGDTDAAIARMQEGLSLTRATGVGMHTTFLLATLAEVRLAREEADEGLAAIAQAFAFAEKTGERYLEAELHRLRGELLLLAPRVDTATEAFEHALAIARLQGARSLELRAATSQAHLWKRDGRKAEARDLLSPVYAGFTEGFETPDLKDAKALLDSL